MKHYQSRRPLTKDEEIDLFKRIKKGDRAAVDEVCKANMGMVIKTATRCKIPGIELEDLIQEGTLGLLKAINEFDLRRGVRFTTFAFNWIRAFMIQYIQNSGLIRIPRQTQWIKSVIDKLAQKLERKPTAKEVIKKLKTMKSSLANEDFIQELIDLDNQEFASHSFLQFAYDSLDWQIDSIPDPANGGDVSEARVDIQKLLTALPERSRTIVELYYGINHERPLTLSEVGEIVGLTAEGVRKVVEKSTSIMQQYAL